MVIAIFAIGAFNLVLGFAVAAFLHAYRMKRLPDVISILASIRLPTPLERFVPRRRPPFPEIATARPPQSKDPLELPPELSVVLGPRATSVRSLFEAQLRVAVVKLTAIRSRLKQLDTQLERDPDSAPLGAEFQACLADCKTMLQQWEAIHSEVNSAGSSAGSLGECAAWFQELQRELNVAIDAQQFSSPRAAELRQTLHAVFGATCAVIAHSHHALARLLRAEGRMAELTRGNEGWDQETRVLNRLEFERLVGAWLKADPYRLRIASFALLDLDDCGGMNAGAGLETADRTLFGFRKLVLDLIRHERGTDRVGLFDGQSVLVMFGDTALRNAVLGTERIRHNVATASFLGRQPLSVSASCAVAEWNPGESFEALIERLRVANKAAKAAGKNCTAVCEDGETRIHRRSTLPTTTREIPLETGDVDFCSTCGV